MKTDWNLVSRLLENPQGHILLFGAPGLGKSFVARKIGIGQEQKIFCVNLTEETAAFELRGYDRQTSEGFKFFEGPVLQAMQAGGRVVIDEIGRASGDALSFLLSALDGNDVAQIHLPDFRIIKPKLGFHVIATTNSSPDDLPLALQDRFICKVEVTEPHPDAYLVLDTDLAAAAKSQLEQRAGIISLRPWLAVQMLRQNFSERDAFNLVFADNGNDLMNALEISRGAK